MKVFVEKRKQTRERPTRGRDAPLQLLWNPVNTATIEPPKNSLY